MEENSSILIVDDIINLFITMAFVLRHKGYVVTTAKDGMKVAEKIKGKFFNLICPSCLIKSRSNCVIGG